jgi:hypothetical protein
MAGSCVRGNKSVFHKLWGTSRIASQEGLRPILLVRQTVISQSTRQKGQLLAADQLTVSTR